MGILQKVKGRDEKELDENITHTYILYNLVYLPRFTPVAWVEMVAEHMSCPVGVEEPQAQPAGCR